MRLSIEQQNWESKNKRTKRYEGKTSGYKSRNQRYDK